MPDTATAAPAIAPATARTIRWSLVLVSVNLLLLAISPFLGLAALATAPAALVMLVIALVRLRRAERARGLRVVLVIGLVVSAFALLYGIGMLIFRGPLQDLADCQGRALTNEAQRACVADYDAAYQDLLEDWGLTLP